MSVLKIKKEDGTWEVISGASSNLPSDWNQNNSNASDYIKNRTHWAEPGYETIVPLQTVEQHCVIELSTIYSADEFPQDVIFVVDGISYEVSNWYDDFGENSEKLYGDSRLSEWVEGAIVNSNSHPEDVPFCALFTWYEASPFNNNSMWVTNVYQLYIDFPEDKAYTVEVKKRAGTVYHTLNVNYLPMDDIYDNVISRIPRAEGVEF
jgi:hypothetical protein